MEPTATVAQRAPDLALDPRRWKALALLCAAFFMVLLDAGAGSYVSPQAFVDGFAAALVACAALSLAGALAGVALPRRRGVTAGADMPIARPRGAEAE